MGGTVRYHLTVKALLKDPLVLFLALGVAIFWIAALSSDKYGSELIEVGAPDINRLQDQWQAQMGRVPTAEELDGLIEQFIREEVYFREAQKLSLEDGDIIVRRRLVQKLRFLTEDIATGQAPAEADLLAWYDTHSDRYRRPTRYSFSHRYFSTDRREDARSDAQAALADPESAGDPFMLQRSYAARSAREIGNLFGTGFAEALAALTPAPGWQGPIRSAYGWHLVQLDARLPAYLPPFEEVSKQVTSDVNTERREQANEAFYQALLQRYEVRRP